jgi:hypothetical protein
MKITVVENPSILGGFEIPVGGVVLWYGLGSEVPDGYTVYAEAFDVMVMGASAGNINTTPAGALTHLHTNTSPTGSEANHNHGTSVSSLGSSGSQVVYTFGSLSSATGAHSHPTRTSNCSSAGGHSHTLSDVGSADNLPPYHRLYWIERTE